MKTESEIKVIESKIDAGSKLKPNEQMEGFQIINGFATDRNIMHDDLTSESDLLWLHNLNN